jgi:hypothetical protein
MTVDLEWPARLPLPVISGYELDDDPSIARTEMELGAPRQRRRSAAQWSTLKATWRFTSDEYAMFEAWLRHFAEYGSWFRMTLLLGLGLVECECRFQSGKAPARWLNGAWVQVQTTLDVRERPMLDKASLQISFYEDQAFLLTQLAAFHAAMAPAALWPHYTP